jgi:very-short-patch-repair endonuclease
MTLEARLGDRAHAMRRAPTEPEKRLWRSLSKSQLGGFKFRRQAVIEPYIADFLCPAKALIVEVDGNTHEPERDWRRDIALEAKGYRTLRFTNADVMGNIEGVVQTILVALQSTPDRWPNGRPHPNPSPEGEGLEASAKSSPSPLEERRGAGPTRRRTLHA